MDLLACPYCKDEGYPLELIVIKEETYPNRSLPRLTATIPLCELYCGFRYVAKSTPQGRTERRRRSKIITQLKKQYLIIKIANTIAKHLGRTEYSAQQSR